MANAISNIHEKGKAHGGFSIYNIYLLTNTKLDEGHQDYAIFKLSFFDHETCVQSEVCMKYKHVKD